MDRSISFILMLSLTISACNQSSTIHTITPTAALPTLVATNAHYVSTNGDDSNPGTQTQPWRTIQKAANELVAGDTVYIRGGIYKEEVIFRKSGTQEQPINVLAYPGEVPIIDSDNYQLPTSEWNALLMLTGNYVEVSGLEVRYSNWMGLLLAGHHDRASNMNVHHNRETGILVSGDYGIVEKSRVWQNANRNEVNSPYTNGGWAAGLSAARGPNKVILRENEVYNNWGEGLSTFEAYGTIMEDNIIYDNWSANIYISDARDVLVQRNFIHASPSSLIKSGSRVGIMMGDETYNPSLDGITIVNNLVNNTRILLYWWQGRQGGEMRNVLIANNTFVNSQSIEPGYAAITFGWGGIHQNVRFENNIIEQDGSIPIGIDEGKGILFANNLWSKVPPANMSSSSDVIGDPAFARVGDLISPEWFRLLPASPAINRGLQVGSVTQDYFGTTRDARPDIGAIEFIGLFHFYQNWLP